MQFTVSFKTLWDKGFRVQGDAQDVLDIVNTALSDLSAAQSRYEMLVTRLEETDFSGSGLTHNIEQIASTYEKQAPHMPVAFTYALKDLAKPRPLEDSAYSEVWLSFLESGDVLTDLSEIGADLSGLARVLPNLERRIGAEARVAKGMRVITRDQSLVVTLTPKEQDLLHDKRELKALAVQAQVYKDFLTELNEDLRPAHGQD